jgi:hypothetical protein
MAGAGTGTPVAVSTAASFQDIIDMARHRLNNFEVPYYWIDKELVWYANEAINQMCRDANILEDSMTASVCELHTTSGVMDYSIANSIIYVRSAMLVTEELMTLDVAPATAWVVGDTITGSSSAKTCVVIEKLTDLTYLVDNRTGTFEFGEVLSNGTVSADQGASYPTFKDHEYNELEKVYTLNTNENIDQWRVAESSEPTKYALDYHNRKLTLYPPPDDVYTIRLATYREQITPMTTATFSSQAPEIHTRYWDIIVNGICAQAYLKRGENTFDPKTAAMFMQLFRAGIADIKAKNMFLKAVPSTLSAHGGFI